MTGSGLSDAALQSLLEQRAKFVGFVRKHVHDPADAEDIVQSAFTRSLERGDQVREEESIVAWFYRVLRNAIIDHYRRADVRERGSEEYANELKIVDARLAFDPSTRDEICQCILPMVDSLKPEYRDALRAVDLEERPVGEFAESINVSENNAGVRLHRARRALRKQVELTCGACATHGCVDCNCRNSVGR